MSPPSEEAQHRAALKRTYTKRLHLLELRAARQGDTVDPQVVTEIDDIKANLASLDLADAPAAAPEVRAAVRNRFDSELEFLIAQFTSITRRQTTTEEKVGDLADQLGALAQHISAIVTHQVEAAHERAENLRATVAIAQALAHEQTNRIGGQRLNFWLLVAAVVAGVLSLAAVVWAFS